MYRIGQEEVKELEKVIKAGKLFRVGSPYLEVENFEKDWAGLIGTKYSLCVTGGTQAIICGLVGMGVGPGDEVIVPAYTFMASAAAVLAVGAIPVLAEIDDTLTIDPADAERKISENTRVIMPVHIAGFPCNMERITETAKKFNLKILEDACQADGGSYRGKRLGSWGDAGAFSFNDYKILSAGEGGALVTDDKNIYERALIYHDGGAAFRPYAEELSVPVFAGVQNRVSELTGAVLRIQLERLEGILADLRHAKKAYIAGLEGRKNIEFIRSNDSQGDCGTTLGFRFENEADARKFSVSEGVSGNLPIDTGKHVYINWKPILEKRGSHHPALNPFNLPENKGLRMDYSANMCPKTLDILKRTVYVGMNPDRTRDETENHVRACIKAGEEL